MTWLLIPALQNMGTSFKTQGTFWTTKRFMHLWFCTNQLDKGHVGSCLKYLSTIYRKPRARQHLWSNPDNSRGDWDCRTQQTPGNAAWANLSWRAGFPSAIQSVLFTSLSCSPMPKAMPENSINLKQHIVTESIWELTVPSSLSSSKRNKANLSIFPLRSFSLLHTL